MRRGGWLLPLLTRVNRYRRVILPDFPQDLVTIKFILGTPTRPEDPHSSEGVARAELMKEVKQEMEEQGDMVMLDVSDADAPVIGGRSFETWLGESYLGIQR